MSSLNNYRTLMTVPEMVASIEGMVNQVWGLPYITAFEHNELSSAASKLSEAVMMVMLPLSLSDDSDGEQFGSEEEEKEVMLGIDQIQIEIEEDDNDEVTYCSF